MNKGNKLMVNGMSLRKNYEFSHNAELDHN
jgi:hypothetical protein